VASMSPQRSTACWGQVFMEDDGLCMECFLEACIYHTQGVKKTHNRLLDHG
jgi:hypothetical protein